MIQDSLECLRSRIKKACEKSHRKTGDIELVLVTKQVSVERVMEAHRLGYRNFGENRVQDLLEKKAALPDNIRWHFIGSLQTNKVKQVLGEVTLIHSCDRLDMARELEKQCEKMNQQADILIQVNTSAEPTKHGFKAEDCTSAVGDIAQMKRLRIRGMMTVGPLTDDESLIRASFSKLRTLHEQFKKQFSRHDWNYLSMGMSLDFEYAIEEGANLLRIGTAVFGSRS